MFLLKVAQDPRLLFRQKIQKIQHHALLKEFFKKRCF